MDFVRIHAEKKLQIGIEDWEKLPQDSDEDYEIKKSAYWASKKWSLLKEIIREKQNNMCAKCGKPNPNQLHHKIYNSYFNESLDDVELVHKTCHAKHHFKDNDFISSLKKADSMSKSEECFVKMVRLIDSNYKVGDKFLTSDYCSDANNKSVISKTISLLGNSSILQSVKRNEWIVSDNIRYFSGLTDTELVQFWKTFDHPGDVGNANLKMQKSGKCILFSQRLFHPRVMALLKSWNIPVEKLQKELQPSRKSKVEAVAVDKLKKSKIDDLDLGTDIYEVVSKLKSIEARQKSLLDDKLSLKRDLKKLADSL